MNSRAMQCGRKIAFSARLRLLCTAIVPGATLFLVLYLLSWSSPRVSFREADFREYEDRGRRSSDGNGGQFLKLHLLSTPGNSTNLDECSDELCSEFLSQDDVVRYNKCLRKIRHYTNTSTISNSGCRFIDRSERGAVALASFPGSGNTWIRVLLERATGVCTGAYCCDISLRAAGFSGEYIQSGSVLVVKTHRPAPLWYDAKGRVGFDSWDEEEAKFSAAIVIIRNPFNALVSEWNRFVSNGFRRDTVRLGTHTSKAEQWHFRTNKRWSEFVRREAYRWKEMVDNWIIQSKPQHPVLVVRYEDIKANQISEVKRILDFLHFPYEEGELYSRLSGGHGSFQRKHTNNFDPYTSPQRKLVKSIVHQTINLAKLRDWDSVLRLEEYLI